jgi:putative SOS response-associated peptidase YedK
MCGRYSVQKKTLLIANGLVKKNINVNLEQDNFNCAPGGKYPCIKSATNGKYLEMTVFGILFSWAKPDFRRLHNARLEGIETKVSFKKLIVNSRAVIPISGFFEWQKRSEKKVPHYFTRTDDQDIFLAGIHDNGQFTIITREAASEENLVIHHRQPVIISKSQINNYFNLNNNAVEFLNSVKAPELKFHPVSTEVNNPSKNDATLIKPVN